MKNDSKTQIKNAQLLSVNAIDLGSVTGGKKVGSLPMVQQVARTCFCAKTGAC